ncbi:MAG: TldD/PmbA family protein [Candidatus Cloacimonetes bacterium]|nr:TldD/PmbA family protein [Candidatus Cloacimonadota bacterium]
MIEKDLSKYSGLFRNYTELRMQENTQVAVSMVQGNLIGNSRSTTSGISARVFNEGTWGFSSSPDWKDTDVKKVIEAAAENARFLSTRVKGLAGVLPGRPAKMTHVFSTRKPRYSQKQLIEFVQNLDNYILTKYPELQSRVVQISTLDMEKRLLTSDGTESLSLIPRSFVMVSLTTMADGQPVDLYKPFGGLGNIEDNLNKPEDLYSEIDKLHENLMQKAEGVYPDAGVCDCVMDADLAGILAHEAIGHTTEADFVMNGSIAAEYMDKKVASPLITLIDYAHHNNGELCPQPVYIDDEGVEAEDTVIIKDGILKSYMHNRESAAHFGVEPTGNARAYSFSDEPLIRMRNTAMVPGISKLEEMIFSIDKGYYLVQPSNGQADSTSEFMFGIRMGYEIINGKIGKAIKDTTIAGVAFDVLETVSMVSDEMKWASSGMCGKKQPMPVGMGGPAIKCKVNIGGR